ncbi:MAG: Flp pilus assembly complex ATPase component TadA [Erysipelothrix sp.]|nr:Flp pilus assembly complex ATPase component TadA [Erysipelothrix sp.]
MNYKKSKFETYDFNSDSLDDIRLSEKGTRWPVVYYIKDDKEIYIGETVDAFNRTRTHLNSKDKNRVKLREITIISNDLFNKSATLDIESNLIEYLNADNEYKIQNLNKGISGHNYYQRSTYNQLLQDIWEQLKKEGVAHRDIKELANTDLFKYSPYKTLTPDQYSVTYEMIEEISKAINNNENRTIIVNGGAGTGKTVLAIYLMKLLSDSSKKLIKTIDTDGELDIDNQSLNSLENITSKLIVPQTSLRTTLGNVFKEITGLKKNMVIGASKIVPKYPEIVDGQIPNDKKEVTVAIVDEAHRLRQNVNVSGFQGGTFKENNRRLGLENGTELDWIVMNSQIQILFYDETQTIKPTDITPQQFKHTIKHNKQSRYLLDSQMRVKGGNRYIKYINSILEEKEPEKEIFNDYDIKLFDNVDAMINAIKDKDKIHSLSRTVAGYAWKWNTSGKTQNEIINHELFDIEIDGSKYVWNSTAEDWVNSPNAINEIGSIHTIQGYDLNFVGVIFGEEITYNPKTQKIEVIKDNYKDAYGKNTIEDIEELKAYIINIYKVFMTRGILCTYVYVCDDNLREYLRKYL